MFVKLCYVCVLCIMLGVFVLCYSGYFFVNYVLELTQHPQC